MQNHFGVDTRPDFKALQEHEVNGLDYRYVNSDKARLSVVVQGIETGSASLLDGKGELHAYYHTDYLGTTDYLTSAVNSKVISWTNYNEWGEITHNAVLKCGARELDLVKEYATHDYDSVLQMYYAKARMYDAYNRRFTAVDPILDGAGYDLKAYVTTPMALNQYLYVRNNAVNWIDPLGLVTYAVGAELSLAFGIRLGTSQQLVFDDNWNIGIVDSYSIGGGTPAASGGFSATITNAAQIYDLSGWGFETGGSANFPAGPVGWGFGAEYISGFSPDSDGNQIHGIALSASAGVNIPVEIHAAFSYGNVKKVWIPKSIVKLIANAFFEQLSCEQRQFLEDEFGATFDIEDRPSFGGGGGRRGG